MSFASKKLGRESEDLAVNLLIQKGYQIVERNYTFEKKGEIDIVAKDKITCFDLPRPKRYGKDLIPFFKSPSTSSISFTISLIRLIKNANSDGIIAFLILPAATPP